MIDSTVTSRKLDTQNKLPPLFKNVIIFSFLPRMCLQHAEIDHIARQHLGTVS